MLTREMIIRNPDKVLGDRQGWPVQRERVEGAIDLKVDERKPEPTQPSFTQRLFGNA